MIIFYHCYPIIINIYPFCKYPITIKINDNGYNNNDPFIAVQWNDIHCNDYDQWNEGILNVNRDKYHMDLP